MAKVVKNLTLDSEAVKAGEKFSRQKGTSISQLVSDLLLGLEDHGQQELSPATSRLLGIGRGKGVADYHEYLARKYSR
ncbi:MAG TPA: DUF6364 family protein [Gemmatimonadaceae bacterium]